MTGARADIAEIPRLADLDRFFSPAGVAVVDALAIKKS